VAEANGADFISSGDPHVDAALRRLQARNDERFQAIEVAMLVQAHLEAAAGRRIKEHAEWLVAHEAAMQHFDVKMLEIEEKLNALTHLQNSL
jgi:hypothetical protein